MPIPPQVAAAIATEVAETPAGKRVLGMVGGALGALLVGLGSGIVGTGEVIGEQLLAADRRADAQGTATAVVSRIMGDEVLRLRAELEATRHELSQQGITLALCEEGGRDGHDSRGR